MKVFMITNHIIGGGSEKVALYTIRILKRNMPDCELYLASCAEPAEQVVIAPYVSGFVHLESSKDRLRPLRYIFNNFNERQLEGFFSCTEIDVIHLHSFMGEISPSIIYAIRKYKRTNRALRVIQTVHDYGIACPNSSLFNYHMNKPCQTCVGKRSYLKCNIVINRCYRGRIMISLLKYIRIVILNLVKYTEIVDTFICPSDFARNILVKEGIASGKLRVIRNPMLPLL